MDKTLAVQLQIRQNAEEISAALKEIQGWEKAVKNKDKALQKKAAASVRSSDSVRPAGGTVPVKTSHAPTNPSAESGLTPASIVKDDVLSSTPAPVPRALGTYTPVDLEEVERERGNVAFRNGQFAEAIKHYTKCLGLKTHNYVAFSNRAMAYIKVKEYARAVQDCNAALSLSPNHVKSLLRRASALGALGKLRAGMRDIKAALDIEPHNKQARTDMVQLREQLKNAVQRAPLVAVHPIGSYAQDSGAEVMQGPDLPLGPITTTPLSLAPSGTISMADTVGDKAGVLELPPSALGSKDEDKAVESSSFHRIAVMEESDEEPDEGEASAPATSSIASKPPSSATAKTKTKSEAASKTKKVTGAKGISSAYELEKLLLLKDEKSIVSVLKSMTESRMRKIMLGVGEPEVIRLLLSALDEYYRKGAISQPEVMALLASLSKVSSFSLLFSLLPRDTLVVCQQLAKECLGCLEDVTDRNIICQAYKL